MVISKLYFYRIHYIKQGLLKSHTATCRNIKVSILCDTLVLLELKTVGWVTRNRPVLKIPHWARSPLKSLILVYHGTPKISVVMHFKVLRKPGKH